ncbi:MAG: DUF4340 domain-containing protein [Alphaproteobacteria bacterium]|nr:DUF4340 domain-containing protein [Alphaproteobacteria bacterium]
MSDPRRRRLGILAVIAALLVVWAIFALWQQSEQFASQYKPFPLFPDLPHQAQTVARIHIAAKGGSFDIANKPGKGWVIATRNDMPASFEQVNKTVVGIAGLEAIEPRTARAGWLHYLSLDAPPKGDGIQFTLYDNKGQQLASVITGGTQDIGDQGGANGLFVRKADSTQSWLAKSTFEPKSDIQEWYDKDLVNIDRGRIAGADVMPQGSATYSVKRDKPKDTEFKLVNLPPGRQLSYPGVTDAVATAATGLTFDDSKAAKDIDFSKATRVVIHTFDGLNVTIQVAKQGDDYWAAVSADAAPGKAAAAKEAQDINAKTSGRAYKLPAYKGQQLMTTLENLLKPLHPAKPAAETPNLGSDDNSDQ